MAGGIGRAAVHLRGVLAGEAAAAVRRVSAVGVHDNLAACQAGISRGSADHEPAGRVDKDPGRVRDQLMRDHGQDHLLDDFLAQRGLVNIRRVLGGNDHGVDRNGLVVLVGDGHLGLSVGIEVRQRAVLADFGKPKGQAVAQRDGQGHFLRGLVAGIAEHHALVAGADVRLVLPAAGLQGVVHAHGDVRALVVDGGHHGTGPAVEGLLRSVVADVHDSPADDRVDIHIGFGRDLAHDGDHAGRRKGLAGNAGGGILLKDRVEHGVGHLVTQFVRMSLGHGFGSKQSAHGLSPV